MNFQAKTKHLKDLHIKFVGNVIIEKNLQEKGKNLSEISKAEINRTLMEIYKDSNGFPFSNKLVYRRKISELNHKFCQKNISIIIWIHITHVHMCINYFLWAYDYVSSF